MGYFIYLCVRVFCALQRTLELKYKKFKNKVREFCLKPNLVEIKEERNCGYHFVKFILLGGVLGPITNTWSIPLHQESFIISAQVRTMSE